MRASMMTRAEPQAPVYICLDVDLQERPLEKEIPLARSLPVRGAPAACSRRG